MSTHNITWARANDMAREFLERHYDQGNVADVSAAAHGGGWLVSYRRTFTRPGAATRTTEHRAGFATLSDDRRTLRMEWDLVCKRHG